MPRPRVCPQTHASPGAHHHRPVPQEVEVAVLAEEVPLGVRGVELLAAHDEVIGKVAPWERKQNSTPRAPEWGEAQDKASATGWRGTKPAKQWLRGGFVPRVTLLGAFRVELTHYQPPDRQRQRGARREETLPAAFRPPALPPLPARS